LVTALTNLHEAARAEPWAVSDAPAEFVQAHLKGIVGFRLPIARLIGKWKMSQNRSPEDRRGVVAGLTDEGDRAEAAVAEVMSRQP
jgi:transcriptional regulator